MKNILSNILGVAWFFGVVIWNVILMIAIIYMVFNDSILMTIETGFSVAAVGFMFCFSCGFFIIITGAVSSFRKCYYKLPWLYPLCMTLYMDMFIISISEMIIYKGYQVGGTLRHIVTVIIVIIQIIVCRLIMCSYLKKNPFIQNEKTQGDTK